MGYNIIRLLIIQHLLRSLCGTGPNRYRHIQNGTRPTVTFLEWHQSRAGMCRSISTFIWCKPVFDFRHRRPLETRYGPAHTGPRLVPVQASYGGSDTSLNQSVPVWAARFRPVPTGAKER